MLSLVDWLETQTLRQNNQFCNDILKNPPVLGGFFISFNLIFYPYMIKFIKIETKKLNLMKSIIKNTHTEAIKLFAKIDGIEQQIEILSGGYVIVDTYDTKTIRVFRQRGFITMEPAQLLESNSPTLISESITFDSGVDSNNDEPMDQFHTTEYNEAILIGDDMKHFQENLMAALTIEENSNKLEVKSNENDPTILEIIEGEVEQYVQAGFIKGEWTEEDIQFLKKYYPTKGRKYCSTHLNRNESSVQKKINALGLKKKKKKTK